MPVVTAGMHIKKATCLARCLFSWVRHFSVNDGKEGVGRATPESNISRTAICQPQVAANDAEISRRFSRPSSSNGPDEGRGDDGQAAAFLDIAGRAEEAFGALQGIGIQAAGKHAARRWGDGIEGAPEAGDGVQQDDHVFLQLDQALGALDHHLGHVDVAGGRFVEASLRYAGFFYVLLHCPLGETGYWMTASLARICLA